MMGYTGMASTTFTDRPDPQEARRRELARFLRAMRDRLSPDALALPVSRRRRARGLLREEVAQAAGMSVTWYTWMEQARPVQPSGHALGGLARALRLDAAERAHLFRLARPDLRPAPAGRSGNGPSPALTAFMHGLAPHPAYLLDERWDVLAWNAPAMRLLGDFGGDGAASRNIMARLFLDPAWRRLFVEWEVIARSVCAQFRRVTASLCADPDFLAFLAMLERESPDFAALWSEHRVEDPPSWRKTLDHPQAGRLRFDFANLHPLGESAGVSLTVYTPADAETAQRFHALL